MGTIAFLNTQASDKYPSCNIPNFFLIKIKILKIKSKLKKQTISLTMNYKTIK